MSQAQVEQNLGRPSSITTSPDDETLANWRYSELDWVNFVDGKVSAVVYDRQDLTMPAPASEASPSPEAPVSSTTPNP